MLHTSTIVVKQSDSQLQDLGVESSKEKFFESQFDVNDIQFHHAYEYETEDGELLESCVIIFKDGLQITTLDNFKELEQKRLEL
jgi:hypothetical protein